MKPLFRTLSYFKQAPKFAFPGREHFQSAAAPRGAWPTFGGGAGRTGRAGEPLVHDKYVPAWKAELRAAAEPDAIFAGAGHLVVNGWEKRGFWTAAGAELGFAERVPGTAFLDFERNRMLANAAMGVDVFSIDGKRESAILAAAPAEGIATEILQGPGAFVVVTELRRPHKGGSVTVETFRVVNYTGTKRGILYGIEALAGITREDDGSVVAAAGAAGPVLATADGIDRRDWQLNPLGQVELSARPLALSVDERGHAHLLSDDAGWAHLRVFPERGAAIFDLQLPVDDGPFRTTPLVGPGGQSYLTSPVAVLAVSAAGKVAWRLERASGTRSAVPATLSGNGLLLLAGETLDAVTPDGKPHTLWRPPAAITTPPVLANEHLYVATADTLYALRPA